MPNITIYLENELYKDFLNLSETEQKKLKEEFKTKIKRCKK